MRFSEQGLTRQELLKTNKKLVNKIVELKQQKNTLEQYLRIEKEVSDETIKELEQQLSELKESRKQKQITRLCNRLDKAEQQNKQMLEALIKATKYMQIQRPFMNYSDDVELYENNIKIIESVTGKKIEEVMK